MARFSAKPPTITAKGQAKIRAITQAVNAAMQSALVRQAAKFRSLAETYAPSEDEEAQMLSEGTAFTKAGGVFAGTPDGGRFVRVDGMISMKMAIAESPIIWTDEGEIQQAVTGSYRELNAKTGFSWVTKTRGLVGPTKPFNRRYAESLENGGVWEVRRRTENYLVPEPKVYAARMIKTLPPRGMFRRARAEVRLEARGEISRTAKAILRSIG